MDMHLKARHATFDPQAASHVKVDLGQQMLTLQQDPRSKKLLVKCCFQITPISGDLFHHLGFRRPILAHELSESDVPPPRHPAGVVRVNCSAISGSYSNDQPTRALHEFPLTSRYGEKVESRPPVVSYVKVRGRGSISDIVVEICDEDNNLLDFKGELIHVNLHLRAHAPGVW